jgi:tetratricopeptide (TPR) repeat protein
MGISKRSRRRLTTLLAIPAVATWASGQAFGEPVVDQALASTQLFADKGCVILKVNFNLRIRYASHFPLSNGDELRITVRPIDRTQAAALLRIRREAARVPNAKAAAIKSVDFETDQATGPVLRILFEHPVNYQVAPGADFESIIVAIAGKTASPACRPEIPPGARNASEGFEPRPGGAPASITPARPKDRPAGKISDADLRAAAAAMDEGRAALKKSQFKAAIGLFTKVLRFPENRYSAEAQELLGLAHHKDGQLAGARSEYEDYVRRYPGGEGHDRVAQRLAGILTAMGEPEEKLRKAKDPRSERNGETGWSLFGSVSAFYIRDDSFRTLRDPSLPPVPNEDKDAHRVHQNTLLSSIDLIGTWGNEYSKSKIRFSGAEEHNFSPDARDRDIVSVAALYVETMLTDWGVLGRVGRQTRSTGGVQGRFDGGLVSWQYDPALRVNLVAGSPVASRRDEIFKDQKLFYGASVDIGPFLGIETSIFAIEQRDRSWLDRRSVGAEFRYFDVDKSALGTIDYDVHFNQLNAAIFSGSWTLFDKSTIYGAADYRKTPYLSAWTALQGQPFLTLYDMLKLRTKEEIDRLAIDRTATYKSAMIGFSHPLTQKLQVSGDATAVQASGMPASGGVEATPSTGTEYYYSAQLIATGLFDPGDMYISGFRFADLSQSKLYVLDFSARYPMTPDLRVNPRVRFGYRKGDLTDLKEYTVLPSVLVNYLWTKDLNLEVEVGTKWTKLQQLGTRETTTNLFLTAGFRYDFQVDGRPATPADRNRCTLPWPMCQWNNGPQK